MKINLILLTVVLLISLILSEAVLSVLGIPRFYLFHSTPPQLKYKLLENNEVVWKNVPSHKLTFIYDGNPRGYFEPGNTIVHTINSLGFRGREFSVSKSANTIRIAFLGDSFTFGEGVKDDDVFPEKIEEYLNSGGASKRYECCNFGVSGYNTDQCLRLLKDEVVHYSPDAVVLCYTLNDIEPSLLYYNTVLGSVKRLPREKLASEDLSDPEPPNSLIYKVRIARTLWLIANRKKLSERTVRYYHSLFDQGPLWKKNRESLDEFKSYCEDRNLKLYITIFPLLYHLNRHYPFLDLHQKIENAISDSGIFIDLLPEFTGNKDSDLRVHPTDQHPNEIAHDITARKIAETIRAWRNNIFDSQNIKPRAGLEPATY